MTDPSPASDRADAASIDAASAEEQANDRYWNSDLGVNQIAEELQLSKSRLYEAIRPVPAGGECPGCGEPLGFPNRTARDRAKPECPTGCTDEQVASGAAAGGIETDARTLLAGLAIGGAVFYLLFRLIRR